MGGSEGGPQNGSKNYFGKLKFALKLFGVSMTGGESRAYKVYSFVLIVFANLLYTFLDFVELFKHDMETVIGMLVCPVSLFMGCTKTLIFVRKRIKIGKLLDKLQQEPFLPNPNRGGEVEEKLMKECIWIINAQTYLYWVSVFVVGSVAVIPTKGIESSDYHDWVSGLGPFTVLNVTYSPNYEITWFYQHFSTTIIGIHIATCDMIVASALASVAFQFKILQNNIRRIVETSYQEMLKENGCTNATATYNSSEIDASMIPWKYLKKSLAQVIDYHLAIISIADEMEDLFNGLLLFVLLSTLGLIAFLAFHTTVVYAVGIPVIAGQLFASCYWAEQVMHESQEVGRAAFEANFVGADIRFQKSLALIMRRSQKPIVFTAGKFTTVCLATFTWIIRASYSTSTVLRHLRE